MLNGGNDEEAPNTHIIISWIVRDGGQCLRCRRTSAHFNGRSFWPSLCWHQSELLGQQLPT